MLLLFRMNQSEMVRGERVHFYPIGIAGRDSDTGYTIGPVRTMKTLMKSYGDQDVCQGHSDTISLNINLHLIIIISRTFIKYL